MKIGFAHGEAAKVHIRRCLSFYEKLFLEDCEQTWLEVVEIAAAFEVEIRRKWPRYHEEMQGRLFN
jgi:isopenicillin-N N-acyltransferase-like protein